MKKQKEEKGIYHGYQLAIFFKTLNERREFEQLIDDALNQTPRHGKANYWGGMTDTEIENFIKGWYE